MSRAAAIPPTLDATFTVETGRRAGLGPGTLRRLPAPHHGGRARVMPSTLTERARAAAIVLHPHATFSHVTAARLHGLWLPGDLCDDLHVTVPPDVRAPRRPGIVAHASVVRTGLLDGIRVVSPSVAVAQLAPVLSLLDLVIALDSVVRWRSRWTVADLDAAAVDGARGVRRYRRALGLCRTGSNSARESLLRLHALDAGLPEPELNARVSDGGRYEYVDLLWRDAGVGAEYHGEYHFASNEQRLRDLDRMTWLRRRLDVHEVTRLDLASARRRDDCLDALARALGVVPRATGERGRLWAEPARVPRAARAARASSRRKVTVGGAHTDRS